MRFLDRVETVLLTLIDGVYARLPQPHPGAACLQSFRTISHRGEHDNRRVFENTLAAFDAAVAQGVWGIEFDLRWTRDLEPVVVHDPDLRRVFGRDLKVGDYTLPDLKRQCPQVPSLAEVVGRYGGKIHLMMELKAEPYPDRERQNRTLGKVFGALRPGAGFSPTVLISGNVPVDNFRSAGGVRSSGASQLPGIQPTGHAETAMEGSPATTRWSETRRFDACMPPA